MFYKSLNHNSPDVSFETALKKGLAPDKGLYFPKEIKILDATFFETIEKLSNEEIAFKVIHPFIGEEIPENELKKIIAETLSFDFPIVKIEEDVYTLELFQGPTMAFKDVGARFMSRCLSYFNRNNTSQKNTILVATSGDTGGAVADGFLGTENTNVVILYPSGKVSSIQEKQLTTLGQNITALEVNGTFDDCQAMVKTAFLDSDLKSKNLTSANSINIARWLPQMFYFFFAYKQLKSLQKPIIISVPSGNFGNICAGILAKKLGLPIHHFVAATNINDTVPRFLENGKYNPLPSKATISNAMDVGDPSNFIRIQELYQNNLSQIQKDFSAYSFSDEETNKTMKFIYDKVGYITDPHGAIGYLGIKKEMQKKENTLGVFFETAHPIKFLDVIEPIIKMKISIPKQIETVLNKKKESIVISTYEELKQILL